MATDARATYIEDMDRDDPPKEEWDSVGMAFLGAVVGLLAGGAHEIWEANARSPTELESFAYMFTEIALSAIVGALAFAVAAEIRNRCGQRRS